MAPELWGDWPDDALDVIGTLRRERDQALAERDRALEDIEVLEVANERKIDVEGELARYREVAEELAEALRGASIEASACPGCARPIYWADQAHAPSCRIGTVLAHYEALRDCHKPLRS